MATPITAECSQNRDKRDYLADCDHDGHRLEHCDLAGGCAGFIVNEGWTRIEGIFICESCADAGYVEYNGTITQR
jgi:hypothetical protein